VNKVKDSVAVPDHERGEKETGMEGESQARQINICFFFKEDSTLNIWKQKHLNYMAMNQD